MDPIREYRKGNESIRIYQDFDPIDPRKEWDNLGVIATWHRRYYLGDEQPSEDASSYIADLPEEAVVLPVYMYDHSGITLSTKPFSCPWDSGQLGIIFTTKERAQKMGISWEDRSAVREHLRIEIEIYDQFVRGDVLGFEHVRFVKCPYCGHEEEEHLDSCWGFYGLDGLIESLPEYLENVESLEDWEES